MPSNELTPSPIQEVNGFNYAQLDRKVAEDVRKATTRLQRKMTETLRDIVEVGQELAAVKNALGHGRWGEWLNKELCWTDRMARHFIDVAEAFGPHVKLLQATIIAPTALYMLAAPSAPFEARQEAILRAQSGETITPSVARDIVSQKQQRLPNARRPTPVEELWQRLNKVLTRLQARCQPADWARVLRHLREFTAQEEGAKTPRKKGKEN